MNGEFWQRREKEVRGGNRVPLKQFPAPELFQKISRAENLDSISRFPTRGFVTNHDSTSDRRMLFCEFPQSFKVRILNAGRSLAFDCALQIVHNKVDLNTTA